METEKGGTKRVRLPDSLDTYELRGADLRKSRGIYPCDVHQCGRTIQTGELYVKLSVGLRWCGVHITLTENDQ